MNDLQNINFDKLLKIYQRYFSLYYLNSNFGDKLAVLAITCYLTNAVRKKGKNVTCYDILLKVCSHFPDVEKNTFLKSLGAICEDLMYGCDTFPDFGVKPSEMPKQLKALIDNYCPF